MCNERKSKAWCFEPHTVVWRHHCSPSSLSNLLRHQFQVIYPEVAVLLFSLRPSEKTSDHKAFGERGCVPGTAGDDRSMNFSIVLVCAGRGAAWCCYKHHITWLVLRWLGWEGAPGGAVSFWKLYWGNQRDALAYV